MVKLPNDLRTYLIRLQQDYVEGRLTDEEFTEILKQIYEGTINETN